MAVVKCTSSNSPTSRSLASAVVDRDWDTTVTGSECPFETERVAMASFFFKQAHESGVLVTDHIPIPEFDHKPQGPNLSHTDSPCSCRSLDSIQWATRQRRGPPSSTVYEALYVDLCEITRRYVGPASFQRDKNTDIHTERVILGYRHPHTPLGCFMRCKFDTKGRRGE